MQADQHLEQQRKEAYCLLEGKPCYVGLIPESVGGYSVKCEECGKVHIAKDLIDNHFDQRWF